MRIIDQENDSGLLTVEVTNRGYRDTVVQPIIRSIIWYPAIQSLKRGYLDHDIRESDRSLPAQQVRRFTAVPRRFSDM